MTNDDSNGDGGVVNNLSAIASIVRAARAFRSGNAGRAALLLGSVLIGRRYPRIGYAIQILDSINEARKQYL